jgi:hypothetical protein
MSDADSRSSPRASVSWRAKIVLAPTQYLDAKVVDISEFGFRLECPRTFPVGSVLQLLVAMPDPNNRAKHLVLPVAGEVKFNLLRGDATSIGLVLHKPTDNFLKPLKEWVEKLTRRL